MLTIILIRIIVLSMDNIRVPKKTEKYRCRVCNWSPSDSEDGVWEHCPNCLSSIHIQNEEGQECGGTLEPVAIWIKPDDSWEIIQKCSLCGEIASSPISDDDSPIKLLSLALKPLSIPPFPIEKMEEIAQIMGWQGDVGGYYNEQRE